MHFLLSDTLTHAHTQTHTHTTELILGDSEIKVLPSLQRHIDSNQLGFSFKLTATEVPFEN